MSRLPEIWFCIKKHFVKDQWYQLEEIYKLIEKNIDLDAEDYEPQSPSSDIPKWKRNVRNVLQYRKRSGEIEWDGAGNYRL